MNEHIHTMYGIPKTENRSVGDFLSLFFEPTNIRSMYGDSLTACALTSRQKFFIYQR